MGMKFGFLAGVALILSLLGLIGCTSSSSSIGTLFVATSGDSVITPFSVTLTDGTLSAPGKTAATGSAPVAALFTPSGDTLFLLNTNPCSNGGISCCPPGGTTCTNPCDGTTVGSITSYTINSDGTLNAASGSTPTGICPVGMAMDGAGSHLYVVNSGTINGVGTGCVGAAQPLCLGTISVFAIANGALTEVTGSPFQTCGTLLTCGTQATGPAGIAVTSDGNYLYVANSVVNTVMQYDVHVGASPTDVTLTPQSSYNTGTTPLGTLITPNGGFLYVANSGSSNVSGYAICDTVLTSCSNPNQPDGTLTEVTGPPNSPFSAGLGPFTMAATADSKFLFVVNAQGNQISQFKISTGTGVLTANSQPTISTGANPVSIAIRTGTTTIEATNGTKNFVYVANRGAATVSSYAFDSTVGTLIVLASTVSDGQPTVVAAK